MSIFPVGNGFIVVRGFHGRRLSFDVLRQLWRRLLLPLKISSPEEMFWQEFWRTLAFFLFIEWS